MTSEIQKHSLGDFTLKSGKTISNAFVAYKTFGSPSNPLIIFPTSYSLRISDNEWLIGSGLTLDTEKYFIVVPALFGNGESTSPSNTPDLRPFPDVTFYDNIQAQHDLVTKKLGFSHAKAVLGWSMGAGQAFQWATQFPDFMDVCVPYCGLAKTSEHDQESFKLVKEDGDGTEEEKVAGLKALGRVYAGWGFSQPFYRHQVYRTAETLGFKDLEDFMVGFWETWALDKDPENMLAMLHTWQAGDVSDQAPYNGDFDAAMKGIKAKILVMPCRTDLYFPPEDSEIEVEHMRPGVGELAIFESIGGHWAGGPGQSVEDSKFLQQKLTAQLNK
ncbi:hypothetical protein CBER1_03603 [Cercospora berteroae]|uniref:AB hydrolase-1 domain-containing protein n=1 Tax=Cercospora berteroae TaxID=357750 RepID=A0A2S6C899_9PEZI|nr:hypothetical protein CBER1_03603 [Cercospora berteroae]